MLVIQGDADNVRYSPQQNRQSTDPFASSRYVRERLALRKLAANGWFEVSNPGGQLRITLGERAKRCARGRNRNLRLRDRASRSHMDRDKDGNACEKA